MDITLWRLRRVGWAHIAAEAAATRYTERDVSWWPGHDLRLSREAVPGKTCDLSQTDIASHYFQDVGDHFIANTHLLYSSCSGFLFRNALGNPFFRGSQRRLSYGLYRPLPPVFTASRFRRPHLCLKVLFSRTSSRAKKRSWVNTLGAMENRVLRIYPIARKIRKCRSSFSVLSRFT